MRLKKRGTNTSGPRFVENITTANEQNAPKNPTIPPIRIVKSRLGEAPGGLGWKVRPGTESS
jgi:hypothetical protein